MLKQVEYVDGLMQERRIANALELHLSCTNPSMYPFDIVMIVFKSMLSAWSGHRWPRHVWCARVINGLGPRSQIPADDRPQHPVDIHGTQFVCLPVGRSMHGQGSNFREINYRPIKSLSDGLGRDRADMTGSGRLMRATSCRWKNHVYHVADEVIDLHSCINNIPTNYTHV